MIDSSNVDSLSLNERQILRTIAQIDIGISSAISRSILLGYNENISLPFYGNFSNSQIRQRSLENNSFSPIVPSFRLFPNPADDVINIICKAENNLK
jgi:hypothetical protein